jgi:hypothetical protein
MDSKSQLSPRMAILVGLLFIVMGLAANPLTAKLVAPGWHPTADAPPLLVQYSFGLIFVLAGFAIIIGYAVGRGADANGNLPADAPLWLYVTQQLLVLGIVGTMGALFSWISIGSGPRAFTMSTPVGTSPLGNSLIGRIAFGIGAVLFWIIFFAIAVIAARRLRKTPSEIRR